MVSVNSTVMSVLKYIAYTSKDNIMCKHMTASILLTIVVVWLVQKVYITLFTNL